FPTLYKNTAPRFFKKMTKALNQTTLKSDTEIRIGIITLTILCPILCSLIRLFIPGSLGNTRCCFKGTNQILAMDILLKNFFGDCNFSLCLGTYYYMHLSSLLIHKKYYTAVLTRITNSPL